MTPAKRIALVGSIIALFLGPAVLRATAQSENTSKKTETTPPAPPKGTETKPGKDRWPVKTASDPDAADISLEPVKTTVENLLAMPRPEDLPLDESAPGYQNHRIHPIETTIWTIEADVIACQSMPDGDYKVTIRGASGQTMVLEMPDPAPGFVDPKSPFASKIKSARSQFDSKQHPERAVKEMKVHAVITGIGFFGRSYGKKKEEIKGNLIQLHPVLNIEWLPTPTKAFMPTSEEKKPDKPASPDRK